VKKSYANSRVVPIWFDDSPVERLNQMAISMEMPRNRIVRRMLELMLDDIDSGRKLYPEENIAEKKPSPLSAN
jgi:hypothetical protein